MAKTRAKRDEYSNVAYASITMSAANALTFAPIRMAVGIFQGVGIVVHKILYIPTVPTIREIVAATDSLVMAFCTSDSLTAIDDVIQPAIIDVITLAGIGTNVEIMKTPIVSDFTTLPGGGKIIPANPLFLALFSAGFTAAGVIRAQIDFTYIELADKDYIELIQSQLPANI